MGLCKCPRKKVTNQFCYEHRVNVCEHCMVAQHPTKQPSGPQGDSRQANKSPVNSLAQSAPPPWRAQSSAPNTAPPLHTAIAPENSVNYGTATNSHLTSSRKVFTATQANFVTSAPDYDEDKYKRRSGFELLSRWIKSRTIMAGSRRRDPHTFLKRWVVLSILIVLGLFTVVYFLMHWGRAAAESDPLLDPRLNPNIRVNDESQDLQPR
ncbi:hypothetical protein MRX96_033018 [Rhipicephalus microplus]